MKTIYRRCPFCSEGSFGIEKRSNDLQFLSCLSKNTSAGMYVELRPNGRYRQVSVRPPRQVQKMSSFDQQQFNKLQTPFWRMMGQAPKSKDIEYEKQLKRRNMTYGDAVLERDYYEANNKSPIEKVMKSL